MSVLCELPSRPHDAAKENYLRLLAQHDDYHREDARRQALVREAIQFAIKNMRPEEEARDARDTSVRTVPGDDTSLSRPMTKMYPRVQVMWQIPENSSTTGISFGGPT